MNELLKLLRNVIGREAVIDGVRCQVIEILTGKPGIRVVLCESGLEGGIIQPDQHGEPHRRTRQTHTIPIHSEIGAGPHAALSPFLTNDEETRIAQLLTVMARTAP